MMAATWGNRPIYNRDTDATSNYLQIGQRVSVSGGVFMTGIDLFIYNTACRLHSLTIFRLTIVTYQCVFMTGINLLIYI